MCPTDFLIDFMLGIKHLLRTIATILPLLALCSFSPPALAAEKVINTERSAPWVGTTVWGLKCQGSRVPYGPYDFTNREHIKGKLFIVEEYHLTERILNLQQDTTTSAINDIQYTLMCFPNHHIALEAAYRYRMLHQKDWKPSAGSATPVECHLQRAINFSPEDPVPYMMLGKLLFFRSLDAGRQNLEREAEVTP